MVKVEVVLLPFGEEMVAVAAEVELNYQQSHVPGSFPLGEFPFHAYL